MKKIIKNLLIIYVFIIVTVVPNYSMAGSLLDWSHISDSAQTFIERGRVQGQNYITTDSMAGLIQGLGSILTTIGVVVVLIGLLVVGIKYMVATPEEAAKLKSKLVGLVIAGIVIIGAYEIWSLAYRFFERNDILR